MTVFPIGTSRLHEPLQHWPDGHWVKPGMGYFHTLSQVMDLIGIVTGRLTLPHGLARYFFRKDQTPQNPFDEGLWNTSPERSIERIARLFEAADTLLIEVSSTRTHACQGIQLQGNPNFHRQVSYAEVWKEGYYGLHEPAMGVQAGDDGDRLPVHLDRLRALLQASGRHALIVGHLVDPARPHPQRHAHNARVAAAVEALGDPRVRYHDPSPHVARHGFRVLADGTLDIHHLPFDALEPLAMEWHALARRQDVA